MNPNNVWKKNREFYIGVAGTVLEGLFSGSLFMLLYSVMRFLWDGQFDMNRVLVLTGVIAFIFLLRILIYSYGYTKAQIGGAKVSKNIRLFMGDHLKRIPLSRFTQGQTGDYINTITSDVNNYEKILTHKIGDIAKSFALSLMLIVFVMAIYFPAGLILLIADLLLIPGLWLSFRQVAKYGKEKNDICAENVSSIVEYVSGIQTFRAYGVGGLKNKTVIHAMQEFSRISFVYEAKVLPIGAGFGILSWLSCPVVIWTTYDGQMKEPIIIHGQKTSIFQNAYRMADTRFAKAHVPGKVNGADHALLLLKYQHSLQIILPGRMNLHRSLLLGGKLLFCVPHGSVLSILC